MSENKAGNFEIHSEARGPHWVAWLTRGDDPKPVLSVLLVGQTREEAEKRAREWTDQVGGYAAR
jgi:hypothetical protein